jgi:formate-dependent nitrite reductase membrane component NrfD
MTAPQQAERMQAAPTEILLPGLMDGRGAPTTGAPAQRTTYYGRPMIKRPTWRWFIPFYFFMGGVAGGAAVVGTAAELTGRERHRTTIRNARYLSVLLALLCPIPLIVDLGRPLRFHHMLRIIKVTSPLNIGTWILSLFGLTSGVLAAKQLAEDLSPVQEGGLQVATERKASPILRLLRAIPSGPFAVAHGLLGLGLGGYTGVLLAVTAVPLWAAAGILMGPMFLAATIASGASALLLLASLSRRSTSTEERELATAATLGIAGQLAATAAREALIPKRIHEPLEKGLWGNIYRYGAIVTGMVAPLSLRLAARLSGRRAGRTFSLIAALLSLTGTLAERFALVEAGKRSADDPIAYQELTQGAPGRARPTPAQVARKAPRTTPFKAYQVAPEPTGPAA